MILNLFQRCGRLRLEVVKGMEPSMRQFVCHSVEKGSTVYTDQYHPYKLLGEEGMASTIT